MKKALYFIVCFCVIYINANSQTTFVEISKLLQQTNEASFKKDITIITKYLDQLSPKEAITASQKLMEVVAELPQYHLLFQHIMYLNVEAYDRGGIRRHSILYCISLMDQPKFNKPEIQQTLLSNIGSIYYTFNEYSSTKYYLEKYLAIDSTKTTNRDINIVTTLGLIHSANNNHTVAKNYFEWAIYKAEKANNDAWIGITHGNLGAEYVKLSKYNFSVHYLVEDINKSLLTNNYESASTAAGYLGYSYLKMKDYNNSKKYLDSATKILINYDLLNNYRIGEARLYGYYAEYFEAMNKYKEAYENKLKSDIIKDTINQRNIRESLNLQLTEINEVKKEQRELLLNKTIHKKKVNEILLFIVIVGAILFIGAITLLLKQKNKINTILQEKNYAIEQEKIIIEQRKNELVQSNLVKTKLFSIIAHDLRSPVSNLQGLMNMLEDGTINQQEFFEQLPGIHVKVETLFGTIDNLLNWTFSQLQGITTTKEKIDIQERINVVFNFLQSIALKKNIQLVCNIQANSFAYADKNQIEIILRNLISNAIKFSHSNDQVIVQTAIQNHKILISIKDAGVGINEEKMNNLFNAINNTSTIGTSGEKGVGLGLLICREFITSNNGKIWVEKNNPKGTIFNFTLLIWKD